MNRIACNGDSTDPLPDRAAIAAAAASVISSSRLGICASIAARTSPPWHWVMGKRAALAPIYRAYHIYVGKAVHGDISHTEALILVDRRGYERSGYLWPFATRFVAHDVRVLAG